MRLPLVFHPAAQEELDAAYAWYEGELKGSGEALLAEVRNVLQRIDENPAAYAQVYRDVRRGLTRRFPYGVFYRIETERIVVLAVYHGSRDPEGWQGRA